MTADAANRTECLEELARLFRASLIDGTVEAVYDYEVMTMENASAIEILDAGSKRMKRGVSDNRWHNFFAIEINSYVMVANTHSTQQGGTNWTSKDVGTKLALIDKRIADVIADNRASTHWSNIELQDDFSVIVEGRTKTYERETEATNYKIESRIALIEYIES